MKLGTLGAGYFSQFHHEAWARMAGVDLVAVCDRDTAAARRTVAGFADTRIYDDLDKMLEAETLDLLDIATPPPTHLAAIRAAAARKIPVICQKPFCESREQAEEAVALAEAAGSLLVVHENFRFEPWHQEIKRLLDGGALGEVYQVSFRLRPGDGQGPRAYLDRQPYFQKMERFLVHETAVHFIDVFRFLLGDARSVYADLTRLNPAIAGEDAGVMLFDFANGARALFDGNRLADHPAENRRLTMGEMLVEGSAATLRLDGDGRLFLRQHGSNEETEHTYAWENRGFAGDSVYAFQRHVIDHLEGKGAIMNSGRDYLTNLHLEEAVYRSNSEGRRLALAAEAGA